MPSQFFPDGKCKRCRSATDGNTGWLNQVLVYPRNGRIGVVCQVVPLDHLGPGNRGVRPMPLPVPPGRPGIQPMPLPLPGGNSGFLPGR
jgi:hypothetical protein